MYYFTICYSFYFLETKLLFSNIYRAFLHSAKFRVHFGNISLLQHQYICFHVEVSVYGSYNIQLKEGWWVINRWVCVRKRQWNSGGTIFISAEGMRKSRNILSLDQWCSGRKHKIPVMRNDVRTDFKVKVIYFLQYLRSRLDFFRKI
jgi:hypothetical protein